MEIKLENELLDSFALEFAKENLDKEAYAEFLEYIIEEPSAEPSYILEELTGYGNNTEEENRKWQDQIAYDLCVFAKENGYDPEVLEGIGEELYGSSVVNICSVVDNAESINNSYYGYLALGVEHGVKDFFESEYGTPTKEEVEQGIYTNDFMLYLGYSAELDTSAYYVGSSIEDLDIEDFDEYNFEALVNNEALDVVEKYAPKFAEELKEKYAEREMEM